LAAWYGASEARSGPDQLRAAARQALGQLITNARRMLTASGTGLSRRADLLKLAGWFHNADSETAHRLYDAAFGCYPARHLLIGPDEPDVSAGPGTSWWESEPVDVPVSLRERGDRTARGRSSRVPDPGADAQRLMARAREQNEARHAAAAELVAAGSLHRSRLSRAARDLLLDKLSVLFAAVSVADAPVEHRDSDLGVRLHAPALRSAFKSLLGYSLTVESSFARLTKGPVSVDGPARPARRPDNTTFTSATYTHLALLCAALLAPGTGEQTLISALIDQVRSDAASIGVQIGDTLPERRALVTAVGHLIGWGVLSETDGTAAGWGERRDEALLTIHRAVLPHMLARPLSGMTHPDELVAADLLAEQPRRSLRRKLVENPFVRREDLTDAERDVLSRERSELTRVLGENFGLTLEVRAEGVLAYDSSGSLTDIAFPGSGTVKQA